MITRAEVAKLGALHAVEPTILSLYLSAGSGVALLAEVAFACSTAELAGNGTATGDPTEVALLELAAACGLDVSARRRDAMRRRLFRFDPRIKLMTTVDQLDGGLVVHTKGAPDEVLARATRIRRGPGEPRSSAASCGSGRPIRARPPREPGWSDACPRSAVYPARAWMAVRAIA